MVNKNLIIKKCIRYDIFVGVKFVDEIQQKNYKIFIYIIYFVVQLVFDRVLFIYSVFSLGLDLGLFLGLFFCDFGILQMFDRVVGISGGLLYIICLGKGCLLDGGGMLYII